ncbi:AFG1/ZapE family ATPase [Cysteiniphilum halobium]|uniref:AFG1/ZapE family ATPase n=1 Tax=Cysteiniphilum halobium TaxID=2219059 RepID=UPI003F83C4DA
MKALNDIQNKLAAAQAKAMQICDKHKKEFRFDCPDCTRESEALAEHQAKLDKRIKESGMHKRHLQASFNNFKQPQAKQQYNICKRFADNWQQTMTDGKDLLMFGSVGTGKTHLACAIANQIMVKHYAHAKYTTFMMLTFAMRDAQNLRQSLTGTMNQFTNSDLLIIDEIGLKGFTEYEFSLVSEIIDFRYTEKMPTILASNMNWQEIVSTLGDRVVSRIFESGGGLRFNNEDYRKILAGGAA